MIFKPRQKKYYINSKITSNNHEIDFFNEVSFLGRTSDMESHIAQTSRKISKSIGIIKKASFYLQTRALVMLYYALVYLYMQYCILVWDSTYPSNLNRIVLLQKRLFIEYTELYIKHHTTLTPNIFSRNLEFSLLIKFIFFT